MVRVTDAREPVETPQERETDTQWLGLVCGLTGSLVPLVAGNSGGVVAVVWWLPHDRTSCPSSSRTDHADHASHRVGLACHQVRHRVCTQPSQ